MGPGQLNSFWSIPGPVKMAASQFNLRLHWTLAIAVLIIDICLVIATLVVDKTHYVDPPAPGTTDKSAAIAWLSVVSSIFVFGCYGVLIKTPSVQEANCDCMVFQCYYSVAVAAISFAVWAAADSHNGLYMTGSAFSMGLLFGVLWIISQVLGFVAITSIGYAVAPAIWIGATIITSFIWGLIFNNPVKSWAFAILAIVFLLAGVSLSALSSIVSDREANLAAVAAADGQDGESLVSDKKQSKGASTFITGAVAAVGLGLCNGSLMVSMTCFGDGCPSIGVTKYTGESLTSLAFLPSLAIGVLVAQPPLFLMYWGRSILKGQYPDFHVKAVAIPGLLTGCYWGMGNFAAMFATVYLGQTIGFPLTQCCLILNGLWGILYYREIRGTKAIGTFAVGAAVILVGASFLGLS